MGAGKVSEYKMALEISHLVTVGCSYTYCQGLDDPTTQGWPALLAQKLNVPIVNLGVKGCGNDSIYRRVAEYFYLNQSTNSKPFFIIAFTQALRREEFVTNYKGITVGDLKNLACYGDEPIERAIYEHIDNTGVYYMERRKLLHWLSVINLLRANNINYFTTNYMADHYQSLMLIQNNYPNLFNAVYKDPNKVEDFYYLTKGMDKTACQHDGVMAQNVVAKYCYDTMLERFKEIKPINSNYVNLKKYVDSTDNSPSYQFWLHVNNAWYNKDKNVQS